MPVRKCAAAAHRPPPWPALPPSVSSSSTAVECRVSVLQSALGTADGLGCTTICVTASGQCAFSRATEMARAARCSCHSRVWRHQCRCGAAALRGACRLHWGNARNRRMDSLTHGAAQLHRDRSTVVLVEALGESCAHEAAAGDDEGGRPPHGYSGAAWGSSERAAGWRVWRWR